MILCYQMCLRLQLRKYSFLIHFYYNQFLLPDNRSIFQVNGDYPYVEVARCYEQRFNYTLFDDYKVYAIYSTSTGEFAPDTNGKMKDVYATINFLEYSRNHWNNSAYGSYPASYQTEERNIVYTDFDVAFENAYCTNLRDFFNDSDSKLMYTTVTIIAEIITIGSNDTAQFDNEWT